MEQPGDTEKIKAWRAGRFLLIKGLKDMGQISRKSKKSITNRMLIDKEKLCG